jgi:hypothetical protein
MDFIKFILLKIIQFIDMLISKAFYRHLPIFLNLFKCPLRGLI